MEGENLEGAIGLAFEGFLKDRLAEGIGRSELMEWDTKEKRYTDEILGVEDELRKAGLDKDTAYEVASTILCAVGDAQDKDYIRGVKDGFNLALHLLGMNRSAAGAKKGVLGDA